MKHVIAVLLALLATLAAQTSCRSPHVSTSEYEREKTRLDSSRLAGRNESSQSKQTTSGATPPPVATLSDHVIPLHYDLELTLRPQDTGYQGNITITLRVTEPTTSIVLHAKNLLVKDPVVTAQAHRANSAQTIPATIYADPPLHTAEMIRIDLAEPLAPGTATLALAFTGRYGEAIGIFRQQRGTTEYVYSDFEPIDARRGFPCFDQPRFKATWSISLVIPAHLRGLSNMPLRGQERDPTGMTRLLFEKSRPLPTYLVAIAVGPFEFVNVPDTLVPMRIVVPKGESARATKAVETAAPLLGLVQEYMGSPVPFPKLDLISVPQFSGAMENPGLITVAEHILLADPGMASIAQQRLLAVVAAHEFAHLWLGDLVTPSQWRDLWLNEGLANWLTSKMLQRWRPERLPALTAVADRHDAMTLDRALAARAVRAPVHTRPELDEIFDAITYRKGSALISMFEDWIGPDRFQQAMREYVAAHADGNVSTPDLIAALGAHTDKPLTPVFESFLGQPGFPVLKTELTCTATPPASTHELAGRDQADESPLPSEVAVSVQISQQRYLSIAEQKSATAKQRSARWQVPFCLRYDVGAGRSRKTCSILDRISMHVELATNICPAWLVPNANAIGYYHYTMPTPALVALAQAPLNGTEATDLARQIYPLLASGDITVDTALDMAMHLAARPERHVHEALADLHATLLNLLPEPERSRYRDALQRIFGPRARAIGLTPKPGESEEDTLLRPTLVRAAGYLGHAPWLVRQARQRADRWLRTGHGIPPGLIEGMLHIAASTGSDNLFQQMVRSLRDTDDQTRSYVLARALGSLSQPRHIEGALALIRDEGIPLANRQQILFRLLERTDEVPRVLAFLHQHRKLLGKSDGGRLLLLSGLFSAGMCKPADFATARALKDYVADVGGIPRDRLAPWADSSELRMRQCWHLQRTHRAPLQARFNDS